MYSTYFLSRDRGKNYMTYDMTRTTISKHFTIKPVPHKYYIDSHISHMHNFFSNNILVKLRLSVNLSYAKPISSSICKQNITLSLFHFFFSRHSLPKVWNIWFILKRKHVSYYFVLYQTNKKNACIHPRSCKEH